jgi:hypothetical protein
MEMNKLETKCLFEGNEKINNYLKEILANGFTIK